ncbi:putative phage tail component-like protein, partial [Cytobacillus horneckiae]|uniref:distal tail protein Dit n=1 Tax=Cytobacillus horneckiae TaxID=549687 RepID=UPI0019D16E2C
DAPYQNGLKEKNFTYDVRDIPVKFLIEDKTSHGLRERFNKLNAYLLGSKKRLEFTDEDAYFIATLKGGDVPDEDSNSLEGTLHFVCTDPAKRKNERTLNLTPIQQEFSITGQGKTPWNINVVFTEKKSKFEVEADNGLFLQLNYEFVAGDRLSISYVGRKVILNGQDLRRAVSMKSNFVELQPGPLSIKASHGSTLKYDERYY